MRMPKRCASGDSKSTDCVRPRTASRSDPQHCMKGLFDLTSTTIAFTLHSSSGLNLQAVNPALASWRLRMSAARPFLIVATTAIVGGGGVAAAVAHAPTRHLVWMVAYLVLVGGVVQVALGLGQALLPATLPSRQFRAGECVLFNLGNAGVIMGTLLSATFVVALGTLVFVASLAMFLAGLRGSARGWMVNLLRGVLLLTGCGAIVGLILTFLRTAH